MKLKWGILGCARISRRGLIAGISGHRPARWSIAGRERDSAAWARSQRAAISPRLSGAR